MLEYSIIALAVQRLADVLLGRDASNGRATHHSALKLGALTLNDGSSFATQWASQNGSPPTSSFQGGEDEYSRVF